MSKQAWRLAAAAGVVVVTVVVVLVVGRQAPDPVMEAVVTADRWRAGTEPGGFVTVEVPQHLGRWVVAPEDLVGSAPAVDVASGVVLSPALLRSGPVQRGRGTVPLRLGVDASLWPGVGPEPGTDAVLAPTPGGCAAAVLELAEVEDGAVVVEVTPVQAALLGGTELFAWPALDGSWPLCPSGSPAARDRSGG